MKKVKVSELEGAALDWAVAKCRGYFDDKTYSGGPNIPPQHFLDMRDAYVHWTRSSTDWGEAGPIIEREGITISKTRHGFWESHYRTYDVRECYWTSSKPLVAAMRTLIEKKFGEEEIEIPEELL